MTEIDGTGYSRESLGHGPVPDERWARVRGLLKDAEIKVYFRNEQRAESWAEGGGQVCYEAAWLIDNPNSEPVLRMKRCNGTITNDRSRVTCRACLEWMHA